jgi:hypothetical protein
MSSRLLKFLPHYYFDKDETNFPCVLGTSEIKNVVYGIEKEDKVLQYWIYYDLDGIGHNVDYEGIIIKLNEDDKICSLVYKPHSREEHFQVDPSDISKCVHEIDGRPIVYVSLEKHSQYPVSGKIIRYGAIANDSCMKPQERILELIEYDYSNSDLNDKVTASRDFEDLPILKYGNIKKRMIFNASVPRKWILRRASLNF